MKSVFLTIISLFVAHQSFAAACCSGGSSDAPIIIGDEKSKLQSIYSSSKIKVNSVDELGLWHQTNSKTTVNTLKLQYSSLISDRWQWATNLSALERKLNENKYFGLGDAHLLTSYEYLHRYSYSSFLPNSFVYVGASLPMSVSKTESENGGLDSFGQGVPTRYIGTKLSFPQKAFNFLFGLQIGEKSGDRLPSSYWNTMDASISMTNKKWSYGASTLWYSSDGISYQDEQGRILLAGPERYTDLTLSIDYEIDNQQSLSVSYTDQTILGSPINTSLSQAISIRYAIKSPR